MGASKDRAASITNRSKLASRADPRMPSAWTALDRRLSRSRLFSMIFLVPCASAHSGRIGTLKHNLSVQINPAITGRSAAVGQGHYQELAQATDTARISRACNPSLGKDRQVPSKATALDFYRIPTANPISYHIIANTRHFNQLVTPPMIRGHLSQRQVMTSEVPATEVAAASEGNI